MKLIVQNIIKRRKALGLSQENMADALSTSQSNYARIEKSHGSLTVDRLIEIAKILDCSIVVLMGIEIESDAKLMEENSELRKKVKIYDGLTDHKQLLADKLRSKLITSQENLNWAIELLEQLEGNTGCEGLIQTKFKQLWKSYYERNKEYTERVMKDDPIMRKSLLNRLDRQFKGMDFWIWLNSVIESNNSIKIDFIDKYDSQIFDKNRLIPGSPLSSIFEDRNPDLEL